MLELVRLKKYILKYPYRGSSKQVPVSAALVVFIVLIAFQNCAPPNNSPSGSSSANSASSSTTQSSTSPNRGISGFGSDQVNPSSGSSGGGSSSGSSGAFGSNGGSSTATGSSGGGTGFRITTQPQALSVREGDNFNLNVDVAGGKTPYTFQWYKNSALIDSPLAKYNFYSDQANHYSKEGDYYIKVTDSSGASITSNIVHVGIIEAQGPCDVGDYMMFNNPGRDILGNTIDLFDNAHGKYLINNNNTEVSWMNSNPGYFSVTYFHFAPALSDGGKATISCTTKIDRIHTPTKNPDRLASTSADAYSNNAYWQYQGAVNFECHNQKYKLASDTCKWVQVKPYPLNAKDRSN